MALVISYSFALSEKRPLWKQGLVIYFLVRFSWPTPREKGECFLVSASLNFNKQMFIILNSNLSINSFIHYICISSRMNTFSYIYSISFMFSPFRFYSNIQLTIICICYKLGKQIFVGFLCLTDIH